MSLADSLKKQEDNQKPNSICSVTKAREKMSKEDLEVFNAALYNREIKATTLGRALKNENIDVSDGTITRHRNGRCGTCGTR